MVRGGRSIERQHFGTATPELFEMNVPLPKVLGSAEIPPEPPLQSLHIPVTPSDPQPPFTHGIGFPGGTSAMHKLWGDPAPLLAQVPLHFPPQAQRARHRRVDEVAGQGFELHLLACPWLPSVPLH